MEEKKPRLQYTVAQELATLADAHKRCADTGNTLWRDNHADTLDWIEKQFLPSGSGIDNGTTIDRDKTTIDKIVLKTAYHHMTDTGYYDGWTEHIVTVKPSFHGYRITISGTNRNDIKDYLYDVFYSAMDEICHRITEDGENSHGWYFDDTWHYRND